MKVLWAPWRMEYVLGQKEPGCPFCPAEVDLPDEDRLILYADSQTLVIMNKFPYNTGHLLVCPRRHVPELHDLGDQELLALQKMVRDCLEILRKVMQPDGFNVGLNLGRVAGAGIPEHLHYQIVPRWQGDVNFMTVFADIRVVPEHILATYRRLFPHFEKLRSHAD
ncbi:HIT domain-containing protein [Thermosulfuriphilus ammonigenes]|uniref:HIT domain-containing protein n=1 Tax=Thermosulfuriphilus ammonigenes TaxID=1936021 RepID=A0A6G7PW88_9BACT|nr:HIT domain-containing protein [Thermosulfuriphilus ammonigenes]MBA2847845.1 ATP adenylyltransferase [Thermosulfuriphilus ammonigenes]QIJ71955.1 HIT domain-containing protein [Thermosulfuriphilus ammonigenes]